MSGPVFVSRLSCHTTYTVPVPSIATSGALCGRFPPSSFRKRFGTHVAPRSADFEK